LAQAWLSAVAKDNGGKQLHCRRLKVRRWESTLVRFFSKDWEEQAADRDEWDKRTVHFAT